MRSTLRRTTCKSTAKEHGKHCNFIVKPQERQAPGQAKAFPRRGGIRRGRSWGPPLRPAGLRLRAARETEEEEAEAEEKGSFHLFPSYSNVKIGVFAEEASAAPSPAAEDCGDRAGGGEAGRHQGDRQGPSAPPLLLLVSPPQGRQQLREEMKQIYIYGHTEIGTNCKYVTYALLCKKNTSCQERERNRKQLFLFIT